MFCTWSSKAQNASIRRAMFAFEDLTNTTKTAGIKLKKKLWERLSMYCSEDRLPIYVIPQCLKSWYAKLCKSSATGRSTTWSCPRCFPSTTWAWVQSARLDGNTIVVNKWRVVMHPRLPQVALNQTCLDFDLNSQRLVDSRNANWKFETYLLDPTFGLRQAINLA